MWTRALLADTYHRILGELLEFGVLFDRLVATTLVVAFKDSVLLAIVAKHIVQIRE